jgi:hypothetical protein
MLVNSIAFSEWVWAENKTLSGFFLKKTGPLATGLRCQGGRKTPLARNPTLHVYWKNAPAYGEVIS